MPSLAMPLMVGMITSEENCVDRTRRVTDKRRSMANRRLASPARNQEIRQRSRRVRDPTRSQFNRCAGGHDPSAAGPAVGPEIHDPVGLGPDVEVSGGVHVELLRAGPPEAIRAEVKRILSSGICEGGRFVLRDANNLAPHTPPEHIEVMYQACREYGHY